jgi:hypothetical protein
MTVAALRTRLWLASGWGSFSQFFPVGQRQQFVTNFLQPLKPPFVISRRAGNLFPACHVLPIRLTDLRYFLSQLYDAVFKRILHDNRLAGHTEL